MSDNRKSKPALESLEARDLLSVIVDVDSGLGATFPLSGKPIPASYSMAPFDFASGVSGVPTVASRHGSLMAEIVNEAGYNGTFISLKASGPDNLFTLDSVNAALAYVVSTIAPAHPHETITVACPFAGVGDDPTQPTIVGSLGFLKVERQLAKAGVTLAMASGNGHVNTDVIPYYPAASAEFAPNVLVVTATEDAYSSPYENYGLKSVNVAAVTPWGSSGAALLGGLALSGVDAYRPHHGLSKAQCAARAVRAVSASATHDAALVGFTSTGGLLDHPGARLRISYRPHAGGHAARRT